MVRPLHTQCQLLTVRLLQGLQEGTRPAPVNPRAPTRSAGNIPRSHIHEQGQVASARGQLHLAELAN